MRTYSIHITSVPVSPTFNLPIKKGQSADILLLEVVDRGSEAQLQVSEKCFFPCASSGDFGEGFIDIF